MNILGITRNYLASFFVKNQINTAFWFIILLNAALMYFDFSRHFATFTAGDRAYSRYSAAMGVIGAAGNAVLPAMVHAVVEPGEYLLVIVPLALIGPAGAVLVQIILHAAASRCAAEMGVRLSRLKYAGVLSGFAYGLFTQNLAFAHEFVTEAICAPFCVFFLHAITAFVRRPSPVTILLAGFYIGVAIFSRPSTVLALPVLIIFALANWRALDKAGQAAAATAFALALAPLGAWTGVFTASTGHFGYTEGVATLPWNLRSKVFLTETANQLPLSPEVRGFRDYPSLYEDPNGISAARFVTIASHLPVPFAKAALTDTLIAFCRGNSTKLTVDYLGWGDSVALKGWRDVVERNGASGLLRWALANRSSILVSALEVASSIGATATSVIGVIYILASLPLPGHRDRQSAARAGFGVGALSLVLAALLSSQLVDRSQGRLRAISEAAITVSCIAVAGDWQRTRRYKARLRSRQTVYARL